MCFRHFLGKHVTKKLGPPYGGLKNRPLCRCVKIKLAPLGIGKKTTPLKTSETSANSEPSLIENKNTSEVCSVDCIQTLSVHNHNNLSM